MILPVKLSSPDFLQHVNSLLYLCEWLAGWRRLVIFSLMVMASLMSATTADSDGKVAAEVADGGTDGRAILRQKGRWLLRLRNRE